MMGDGPLLSPGEITDTQSDCLLADVLRTSEGDRREVFESAGKMQPAWVTPSHDCAGSAQCLLSRQGAERNDYSVRLKAGIGWQPVLNIMEPAGVALYGVIGYSSPATSRARKPRVDPGAPVRHF